MSTVHACLRVLWRIPGRILVLLVRCYQLLLSPLLGGQCRYYPSCSNYFIQAVEKYGAVKGAWKGILRILRCHPWHAGGYDPP